MTDQENYIAYLETKTVVQASRISELEAALMLLVFNEANPVNKDFMYLWASCQVYRGMPFRNETINKYKELLNDNPA